MKLTLILSTKEGQTTSCTTNFKIISFAKKIVLYISKLIAILLITVLLALIPLLHIFMLVGGISLFFYVAFTGIRAAPKFADTEGVCPNCSASFLIFRKSISDLPFNQLCDRCHKVIHVETTF